MADCCLLFSIISISRLVCCYCHRVCVFVLLYCFLCPATIDIKKSSRKAVYQALKIVCVCVCVCVCVFVFVFVLFKKKAVLRAFFLRHACSFMGAAGKEE